MKRIAFHPEARAEYLASVDYYNDVGLGSAFADEFEIALDLIISFPSAWPPLAARGTVRRCLLRRFPYGIVYAVLGDEILVLAIAHARRSPRYWRHRRRR